jgi:SAM-dependent methyltransferase
MTERDYVLGTHDAEIERLARQHEAWRRIAQAAWRRAGIGPGQTVLDLGAGPGWASLDLAELVGATGTVLAIERSDRFLAALARESAARGLHQIRRIAADLVEDELGSVRADAAWCRWVLSFVSDPPRVVRRIARALRPGGVAVFHEYLDYGSWRLAPPSAALERFVSSVMASWRRVGGEPNIALSLPSLLVHEGFELIALEPRLFVVQPGHPLWDWLAAYVGNALERLPESGDLSAEEAAAVRVAMRSAAVDPAACVVTPCVLEIIARQVAR